MLKQDYHIHCELSPDSTAALDVVCSQAYRLGLEEVAFTDHYELIEGVTARGSIRREYLEISREKLLACRSRWEGRASAWCSALSWASATSSPRRRPRFSPAIPMTLSWPPSTGRSQ